MIIQTFDLSYSLDKKSFGNVDFQKLFVYQSTLDIIELLKDEGADDFLSWKSKGVYTS